MRDAPPQTIYLKDYTPFGFRVDEVHLTFDLSPTKTRVTSRIRFSPDEKAADPVFYLHGENLALLSARIDGQPVTPNVTPGGLTCEVPRAPFVWEAEVEINPEANTALEGLYLSGGMYCTQCEAEGFRKITYYPDRPDVMSTFTVRINGPHPVLLSNGNPVASGDGWAEWHDPWPKPAYLFALVAGDLLAHKDVFETRDGRKVDLALYVRPGDEGKCAFGMQALKDSMKWDEEVYGRIYDLDVFNIVAVDDFNMGAMENKGLNIFNSAAVLASPETSTDSNFERIEAIIAHEYFHNWTGNRITCRDWFQLCLKEGLTVFRDAQFTGDMRSEPVKRISDVIELRARQFPEDQGPLAHPVRPDRFQEINNFYTTTVYEKGAEVIGMLKTLVGDATYYKAVDLYFERHDGQACTIEDWLKVFEDTTGRDLSQFKRWYTQAGTPIVTVQDEFSDGVYAITFEQHTPPSAASPKTQAQVIPMALGLLAPDGTEVMETTVLEITQERQSFKFKGFQEKPIPSLLRGFSAPVVLNARVDDAFLVAHDTDTFCKWEAARNLAKTSLLSTITLDTRPDQRWLDGVAGIVMDAALDPAYRAFCMALPSQSQLAADLSKDGTTPDPDAIWTAHETHKQALAEALSLQLPHLYSDQRITETYAPNAEQSGKRALGNAVLSLLTRLDEGETAQVLFEHTSNMTQQLAALANLIRSGRGDSALADFESQWKHDRLVMDKWFALQVIEARPEKAAETAHILTQHSDFNWKNPNRFRAVLGSLAAHHAGFHAKDGAGYAVLTDWLIKLDPLNPQTTARMCSAFQTWRRYDDARQSLISAQLDRIAKTPELSRDTSEMIARIQTG